MKFKDVLKLLIIATILNILLIISLVHIAKVCAIEYIEAEPREIDVSMYVAKVFDNIYEVYEEPIIGEIEYLTYSEEDYELLAHVIFAEAGSDKCSDKMQYYVGSVVLNRIDSKYFPNNMYDVVYAKGQYACTWNGAIHKTPNERAYNVARNLLENGSILPSNVVFQAQFKQGDGVYWKEQNMYFCYKN